ncbi:DUF11 domain-containing protein [candidate division KSB1 bacterium]|nr:DUF11 domain-containing protein [candidate division KSB1 bacterium]
MFSRTFIIITALVILAGLNMEALAQADNPVMDMRVRIGEVTCDSDSMTMELWFDVRTTDGSEWYISQMQNSILFDPHFNALIDTITSFQWNIPFDSYVLHERFTPQAGVLEFSMNKKYFVEAAVYGGPDSLTWHAVVGFHVRCHQDVGTLGVIDWWGYTPHYNVRAYSGPGADPETIYNRELSCPLDVPLYCGQVSESDIEILKSVIPTYPDIGQAVTYTVTVRNKGLDDNTNIVVEDYLPPGIIYISSPGGTWNSGSRTIIYTIASLAAGMEQTFTINGIAGQAGLWTNHTVVVAADTTDPNPWNNSEYASVYVDDPAVTEPEVRLTKTANPTTQDVGGTVTFTVSVTNDGPGTVTDVEVTDILHDGFTYMNNSPSEGSYSPASGIWSNISLGVGETATLEIQATADEAGLLSNYALITRASGDDSLDNNDAWAYVLVGQHQVNADLAINKELISSPNPVLGDNVEFNITVTNNGPDAVVEISIQDHLPVGIDYVSDNASGAYEPATGIWQIITLGNGASRTLRLTGTVTRTGYITNCAFIYSADANDSNTDNNSDCVTIFVEEPQILNDSDLQMTKSMSPSSPPPIPVGTAITFTLAVYNAGPDEATSVTVVDTLPAGVTYVSSVPTGAYNAAQRTVIWNVASIANGVSAVLTINTTAASAGEWRNVALVAGSNSIDPNPDNDDDEVTFEIQPVATIADLEVWKSVLTTTPSVNDPVIYTLTVHNNGPDAASGVTIVDYVPVGVTYNGSIPPGNWNPGNRTLTWSIASVAAGASSIMTINTTAAQVGVWTNHAVITGSSATDPDSTNNTEYETIEIDDPLQVVPDLELTKTANPTSTTLGGSVQFIIHVTNNGPGDAANVQVTDLLHAGFHLHGYSVIPVGSTFDETTGIWDIGSLTATNSATLTLNVTTKQTGELSNYAVITRVTPGDSNLDNNGEEVFVTVTDGVTPADLSVTKTIVTTTPVIGQPVTFQITVTNGGPGAANDVQVFDKLPVGIDYQSDNSGGNYNPATGIWDVGTLTAGGSAVLQITGLLNDLPVTNCAWIYNSSAPDNNDMNNIDCHSIAGQLGGIDTRLVFISNTYNTPNPGEGELVFAVEAHSNDGLTYSIGNFQDIIELDPILAGQIPAPANVNFSNQYFDAVHHYTETEGYDPLTRRVSYQYTWNSTPPPRILDGTWTEVLRLTIIYIMIDDFGAVSWTSDPTYSVLDDIDQDITGVEIGDLPAELTNIPLPVELTAFTAVAMGNTVELSWTTQSETENLGFDIYRAEENMSGFIKLNRELLKGLGTSEVGRDYHYTDRTVLAGKTYFYKLADVDYKGQVTMHEEVKTVHIEAPSEYVLEQNYPNPFNPETKIRFKLKAAGQCEIKIFNLKGQKVRTLTAGYRSAGTHVISWDGKGDTGNIMPSGIYLYELRVNGYIEIRKMEFLK